MQAHNWKIKLLTFNINIMSNNNMLANKDSQQINKLYPEMQEAFEEFKKKTETRNLVFQNEMSQIEKYGAVINTLGDMLSPGDDEIEYIINKLVPRGEISMIYGNSGCGKSTIIRTMLFAVAFGLIKFLDFEIIVEVLNRKVALVVTEESARNLKPLIKIQAKFFDKYRTIEEPVFDIISSVEVDIVTVLTKRLEEVHYSWIVIDTPQDNLPGSINESTVIRQYFKSLSNLAYKYNVAITVVMHKRKYTGDKPPSREDLAGSQALNAIPRVIYELREDVCNPLRRNLTPVKANFESFKFLQTSFVLEFHEDTLTFSDTGERITIDQVGMDTHRININNMIIEKIKDYKHSNPSIKQKEIIELLKEEFPSEKIDQPRISRLMKKISNDIINH